MTNQPRPLRAAAEKIAAEHADLEIAAADRRQAAAEVLERLLEAVRPACRALASRVAISCTESPAGTTTEPAAWRGLFLTGTGPKLVGRTAVEQPGYAREAWPERGRHGGTRLLLRDDGKLVEMAYDGPWSNVPGEVSSWRASAAVLEPIEAVARGYHLDAIAEAIGTALDAQAGGASRERAAELRAKAERLRALAQIVRGL